MSFFVIYCGDLATARKALYRIHIYSQRSSRQKRCNCCNHGDYTQLFLLVNPPSRNSLTNLRHKPLSPDPSGRSATLYFAGTDRSSSFAPFLAT